MAPNCSGVTRRPWVCTLNWYCWSGPTGRAPIRPTAATVFCCATALVMSVGDRFRLVSRLLSNQIRIEYFCRDSRLAWPTPGVREIPSMTLIVM